MKTVFKLLLALLVGGIIGFIFVGISIVLFSDTTLSEFVRKAGKIDTLEMLGVLAGSILCTVVAFALQIVIHEGGHWFFGWLSGYRFVSFRIFSWTLIRVEGKIRLKRFGVAGTAGQCLLVPPDKPLDEIPIVFYHLGGVIANMTVAFGALFVFLMTGRPFFLWSQFWFLLSIAGFLLALMNGIPFSRFVSNDASNVLLMRKNPKCKLAMMRVLRVNAWVQEGIRAKDMPDDWFACEGEVDYRNPLEVNAHLMRIGRLMDQGQMEEAYLLLEKAIRHKGEMIGLLAKEVVCELICLDLVTGHNRWTDTLYTEEIDLYVRKYCALMSSKQRFLCAWALYKENDRDKARRIYEDVIDKQSRYLLQGEVKMDIAMMEAMFRSAQSANRMCSTTISETVPTL